MYDHDDEETRQLLAPLRVEPAGPATVDVRRAVSDGRRRLRGRRFAGAGAVAAAVAATAVGVPLALDLPAGEATGPPPGGIGPASPTAASGPPGPRPPAACEVEVLPVPEDAYQSLVHGADPTGRYLLGRSFTAAGAGDSNVVSGVRVQVLMWTDGDPVEVDMPGHDAMLRAANQSGTAVGTSFLSYDDLDSQVSWLYRDGQLVRLPGTATNAVAINADGVIAGGRKVDDTRYVPVVWRSAGTGPEDLSLPGPTWTGQATGIDTDGTVVGSGYDGERAPEDSGRSFVWHPDGTRDELPVPDIDGTTAAGFNADSIHNGVVTGRAEVESDDGFRLYTVRYDPRTGEFTNLSAAAPVFPAAVNGLGWVAGPGPDGLALWPGRDPAVPLPVPDLPELESVPPAHDVVVLSDDGRVVAGQLDGLNSEPPVGDGGHPVSAVTAARWHCR